MKIQDGRVIGLGILTIALSVWPAQVLRAQHEGHGSDDEGSIPSSSGRASDSSGPAGEGDISSGPEEHVALGEQAHGGHGDEEADEASAAGASEPDEHGVWVCPMGDYRGPKTSDGRCPKCGMKLEED